MLIPIGQENAEVRRHPWVSYAIILFNIAVFAIMVAGGTGKAWQKELQAKIKEIETFLVEHPYLEIPGDLKPYTDEDFLARWDDVVDQYKRAGLAPQQWAIDRQEMKLRLLTQELIAIQGRSPARRLGFVPAKMEIRGLISSMFVHGGLGHLLGNMLFLFVTGPFLEDVYGRLVYPVVYFIAGIAGALAHATRHPDSEIPLIGASGAIAGIMGAFLVRLARRRFQFLFMPLFPIWIIRWTFFVPAFVFIPLWFAEQVLMAKLFPEASVAWWAHIGGLLAGVVCAFAVKVSKIEEKWIHPSIEKQIGWEQHPGLVRASEARTRGDFHTARLEITKVLQTDPGNFDAIIANYNTALDSGDLVESGKAASRLLEAYVLKGEHELIAHLLQEAPETIGRDLPAKFYLTAASYKEKSGDVKGAYDTFRYLAEQYPEDPTTLRGLIRMADLLKRTGQLEAARAVLERARVHPACTDTWRQQVERSLGEVEARLQ